MSFSIRRPALFYDGSCPLCAKEISILRSRSNGALILVDIHGVGEHYLSALAVTKRDLLERLHLVMPSGEILIGLDANIVAWHIAGGHQWLSILKWPGVYWIAKLGYFVWAKRRFKRLYCGAAGCNEQLA